MRTVVIGRAGCRAIKIVVAGATAATKVGGKAKGADAAGKAVLSGKLDEQGGLSSLLGRDRLLAGKRWMQPKRLQENG